MAPYPPPGGLSGVGFGKRTRWTLVGFGTTCAFSTGRTGGVRRSHGRFRHHGPTNAEPSSFPPLGLSRVWGRVAATVSLVVTSTAEARPHEVARGGAARPWQTMFAALVLAVAPHAGADDLPDPSYSYVSVQYGRTQTDAGDLEVHSVVLGGSVAWRFMHVWGGIQTDDVEVPVGDVDQDGKALGLGLHRKVANGVTAHVRGAWLEAGTAFSFRGFEVEEPDRNGRLAEVGVRSHLTPGWEVHGALSRVWLDGRDPVNSLVVTGEYRFDVRWGFNLAAVYTSESRGLIAGARFHF